MTSIFKSGKISFALLVLIFSILVLSNSNICNAYEEYDFTIEDLEFIPDTSLQQGETLLTKITIKNNLEVDGTVNVILPILPPGKDNSNWKNYLYPDQKTLNINAGETRSTLLKWPTLDLDFGTYMIELELKPIDDASFIFDSISEGISVQITSDFSQLVVQVIIAGSGTLATIVVLLQSHLFTKEDPGSKKLRIMAISPFAIFLIVLILAIYTYLFFPSTLGSEVFPITVIMFVFGVIYTIGVTLVVMWKSRHST